MKLKYKDKLHHQELYLGDKKNSNYFEGWYFKHTDMMGKYSFSIIVGILKGTDRHSFIQIIDNIKNKSYYARYNVKDFSYSNNPFYINIANNSFSMEGISIDINTPIKIKVDIKYNNLTPIKKSIYAPNIMGIFAYVPFMECNHAVISLKHNLEGYIDIYNKKISFNNGLGYIEKDYGTSFPNKYLWLQASNNSNSIFLSMANIPFLRLRFKGFICVLSISGKEYRFATYYFDKSYIEKIANNEYLVTIMQGRKKLVIKLLSFDETPLAAPRNGSMREIVKESLNSICYIELYIKKKLFFKETFSSCSSEIFNY